MNEINLKISGMDCVACATPVLKILKKQQWLEEAHVNYLSGIVNIRYSSFPELNDIEKSLEKAGFILPRMKVTISCENNNINDKIMTELSNRIRQEIIGIDNVSRVVDGLKGDDISLDNQRIMAVIMLYQTGIRTRALIKWFSENGLQIRIDKVENCEAEVIEAEQINMLRRLILAVMLSIPIFLNISSYLQFVFATLIQIFPCRIFYRGAYRTMKSRKLSMDFLISLSTTIIYLFSTYITFTQKEDIKLYFLCEGVLVSIILFGRYLEIIAKGETVKSLRNLINMIPQSARVYKDDIVSEKNISEIEIGDNVIINRGDRIPVDGIIIKGQGIIDESVMTGESIPVGKNVGEHVVAGCIVREGDMLVRVECSNEDSAICKIIDIVKKAQNSSAPIQKKADKIASIFIPIVLIIAAFVFVIHYYIVCPGDFEHAIITTSGVLVVACPCALGLAIPTSIMVGTGRAAELGILFKNASCFEQIKQLTYVAIDKTGTLTVGGDDVNRNELRQYTKEFIKNLKKKNIAICMISGDKDEIVADIAQKVGIDKFYSTVKPCEKADIIKNIKEKGYKVAMIGDGVNDAPAMAVSDIGISLQNATQIARDAADIIILNDDIKNLERVFTISDKIIKNIKGNLMWALCYNVVCIPAAAIGIMNPSIASAAMSFSSIAVLLHSLRLKTMLSDNKDNTIK